MLKTPIESRYLCFQYNVFLIKIAKNDLLVERVPYASKLCTLYISQMEKPINKLVEKPIKVSDKISADPVVHFPEIVHNSSHGGNFPAPWRPMRIRKRE